MASIAGRLGVLTASDEVVTVAARPGYSVAAVQTSGREVRILLETHTGAGEPPAPVVGRLA